VHTRNAVVAGWRHCRYRKATHKAAKEEQRQDRSPLSNVLAAKKISTSPAVHTEDGIFVAKLVFLVVIYSI
jgi:hypothetical protein